MLPLTFLSSVFMQQRLAVNWRAEASRSVSLGHTDWSLVASRSGLLALLLLAATALATRAFGAYQRSL